MDISKAYDAVNHCGVFVKLMERRIPWCLLRVLAEWFPRCSTCIKWANCYSGFFPVDIGVRQGSCLAPALFATYINDMLAACNRLDIGHVIVYADDILLITRSVHCLQVMFDIVCGHLVQLDLALNLRKSVCMRVGPRFESECANICTSNGGKLEWVSEIKYLGIFFKSGRTLRCCFDVAKRKFNRAVNCVLGKIGICAKEDVLVNLVNLKCMPILLYGTECCDLSKRELNSLDFTVVRFFMKIFRTSNRDTVLYVMDMFGAQLPSACIARRRVKFCNQFTYSDNNFCKFAHSL